MMLSRGERDMPFLYPRVVLPRTTIFAFSLCATALTTNTLCKSSRPLVQIPFPRALLNAALVPLIAMQGVVLSNQFPCHPRSSSSSCKLSDLAYSFAINHHPRTICPTVLRASIFGKQQRLPNRITNHLHHTKDRNRPAKTRIGTA